MVSHSTDDKLVDIISMENADKQWYQDGSPMSAITEICYRFEHIDKFIVGALVRDVLSRHPDVRAIHSYYTATASIEKTLEGFFRVFGDMDVEYVHNSHGNRFSVVGQLKKEEPRIHSKAIVRPESSVLGFRGRDGDKDMGKNFRVKPIPMTSSQIAERPEANVPRMKQSYGLPYKEAEAKLAKFRSVSGYPIPERFNKNITAVQRIDKTVSKVVKPVTNHVEIVKTGPSTFDIGVYALEIVFKLAVLIGAVIWLITYLG